MVFRATNLVFVTYQEVEIRVKNGTNQFLTFFIFLFLVQFFIFTSTGSISPFIVFFFYTPSFNAFSVDGRYILFFQELDIQVLLI